MIFNGDGLVNVAGFGVDAAERAVHVENLPEAAAVPGQAAEAARAVVGANDGGRCRFQAKNFGGGVVGVPQVAAVVGQAGRAAGGGVAGLENG